MNTTLPFPATTPHSPSNAPIPYERFGFCWGAVLAGLTAAIALDVLFAELGLALNLGIIDRQTSGGEIALANGVAWVVTGLIALFAGAWIAGRMASTRTRLEGGLHGIGVWGAGAVVMLVLAFTSAGVVGSGMLDVVGKGLEGAGVLVQTAAPKWDSIKTELEGAMDARVGSDSTQASVSGDAAVAGGAGSQLIDRSRLLDLADRHFTVDGTALASGERDELVQLIAGQTGMSKSVADRTLKQWDTVWARSVQTYETAKQEALATAEKARVLTMAAASWAAVAMLLGAAAAMFGGAYGAQCRLRALEREFLLDQNSTTYRRADLREDASGRVVPQPLT